MRAFLVSVSLETTAAAAARDVQQRIDEQRSAAAAAPPKRGPGRPRAASSTPPTFAGPGGAAAAESAASSVVTAVAGLKRSADEHEEEPPAKRHYNQWLASPLLPHILKAYRENGFSARAAVRALQKSRTLNVDGCFDTLSVTTVWSWFDPQTHQLLPRVRQLIDNAERYTRIGTGRISVFDQHRELEQEIVRLLTALRDSYTAGVSCSRSTVRWVMRAVLEQRAPSLLERYKLSKQFLSDWARNVMGWSWRAGTTAASKLPADWQQQASLYAKRIAVAMHTYTVHPSLVINLDQTGIHFSPSSTRTYAERGSRTVAIAGAEDKRQITAVIGSTLDGQLLPLQLIFQGKTDACHPLTTPAHLAVQQGMHITHSFNHWSNQATMREYIKHVVEPWRAKVIAMHSLSVNAAVVLVLDVWKVHISQEFRSMLADDFPHIHLVYVPANCTSKLQPADYALNYPLKHAVKRSFDAHASAEVLRQVKSGSVSGLRDFLKLSSLKPLLLDWLADAWARLAVERVLIQRAWHQCVVQYYDVHDAIKRAAAVQEAVQLALNASGAVPVETESDSDVDAEYGEEESDDEDKPAVQIMRERVYGERRSARASVVPQRLGYMVCTDQLRIVPAEDEDL